MNIAQPSYRWEEWVIAPEQQSASWLVRQGRSSRAVVGEGATWLLAQQAKASQPSSKAVSQAAISQPSQPARPNSQPSIQEAKAAGSQAPERPRTANRRQPEFATGEERNCRPCICSLLVAIARLSLDGIRRRISPVKRTFDLKFQYLSF